MFALAGFVFGGVAQELWRGVRARRAVSREPVPRRARLARPAQPAPLRRLPRAPRDHHAVRRRRRVLELQGRPGRRRCSPGQTAKVGGYEFTYVKPIAELHAAPNGRLERIAFGAQLSVRKGGGKPRPLRTSKDYFPSQDTSLGPVSRFFDGESTTEVGLDASLRNDIWAAVAPDIAKLRPRIDEGDKLFDKAADDLTPEQSNEFLALALRGLTDRYAQSPPPARFRLEVNPLVTWIWIGGLIVLLGGFIAGWPAKRGHDAHGQRPLRRPVGRDVREPEQVPGVAVEFALILLVVAGAVLIVTGPLRGRAREADERSRPSCAELEAAKEAKYREIRDAELDYETGKLSDGDWRSLDRTLRAEAVELLKRLDRVHERAESLP